MHVLLNISQIKGNQKMKFCQLVEYNKRNILLQKSCWKWGRETSAIPVFVFKKVLDKVKISGLQLGSPKLPHNKKV